MTTIEKVLIQIFERKNRIIDHVKQQILLFDHHLASKCLIDGIVPPPWLLSASPSGNLLLISFFFSFTFLISFLFFGRFMKRIFNSFQQYLRDNVVLVYLLMLRFDSSLLKSLNFFQFFLVFHCFT